MSSHLPSNALDRSPFHKQWAILGIGLSVLMFTLNVGTINIALPTLVQTLQTDFTTVQWVVLSYLLVITTLVLSVARLGDIFGKKQLYLGGLILFTLSSLLCSLSPSVGWLIGFRSLQGLGAVCIAALGAAIITEIFPASKRGQALGMIAGITSTGIAIGPSVGGLLIGLGSWRTIFWLNVPIGAIAGFLIIRFVPSSVSKQVKPHFDILGALILMVTLSCFALGMTNGQRQGFGSGTTLTLLIVAAMSCVCFLRLEFRLQQPMLNLEIFRNLQFSLFLLRGTVVFIVVSGSVFIMPFFLELVKHYPPGQVGLMLAVSPVLAGLVSPTAGALSDRFGTRLISLTGLVLLALGCLLISTFDAQLTVLGYIIRYVPFGLGLGLFQSPNNSAIMGSVPKERLGIASGLLALSRTLGQMMGLPLVGALFAALTSAKADFAPHTNVTTAPTEALVFGLQGAFRVEAVILVISIVVTSVIGRLQHRQHVSKWLKIK